MAQSQMYKEFREALKKLSFRKGVEGPKRDRIVAALCGQLVELHDAATRYIQAVDDCDPRPLEEQAEKFFRDMDYVISELGCILRRVLRLWETNAKNSVAGEPSAAGRTYKETDWVVSAKDAKSHLGFLRDLEREVYPEDPVGHTAVEDISDTYADMKEIVSVLNFIRREAHRLKARDIEHLLWEAIICTFQNHTAYHLHTAAYVMAAKAGPYPIWVEKHSGPKSPGERER